MVWGWVFLLLFWSFSRVFCWLLLFLSLKVEKVNGLVLILLLFPLYRFFPWKSHLLLLLQRPHRSDSPPPPPVYLYLWPFPISFNVTSLAICLLTTSLIAATFDLVTTHPLYMTLLIGSEPVSGFPQFNGKSIRPSVSFKVCYNLSPTHLSNNGLGTPLQKPPQSQFLFMLSK